MKSLSLVRRGLRLAIAAALTLTTLAPITATVSQAASGGSVWLTGHDADFHCQGFGPQCHYFGTAVKFVVNGSSLPVLVLDHGGEVASSIPSMGASAPPFVVVDPRTAFAATPLLDASGNPLYSAMIVASDTTCGGCDNNGFGVTPDSDAINARSADIAAAFNKGMGIFALAGAENRAVYYKFLPVPATAVAVSPPFKFTAAGLAAGLVEGTDDNCCPTHNSFQLPAAGSALQVFETDSAGFAETLAAKGVTICTTGFCGSDATPPACALTAIIAGPPKQLQITVQDTGSGLKSIVPTAVTNATVSIPAFTAGTTSPVVVTATKIDQALGATVTLQATDVAGNVTTCDPAMVTVNGGPGKPVSKVVTGVAQAESTVSIYNSTPGLKQVNVTVNGKLFKVARLHDGEVRTIDVAAGLKAGNHNTIVLTPRGNSGSAEVLISDMGKHTAAQHGAKHQVTDRQEQQDSGPLD